MTKAPKLRKNIQGIKKYSWRMCPYATGEASGRIPSSEKTLHTTTSGFMSLDIRGGHDGVGWVCRDPNCSYFKGTASTAIHLKIPKTQVNRQTGEYTITVVDKEIPMCSGIYFWEK